MGDALFCPNCGTRQEGLPKFCFQCGTDLSAIVAKRMAAAQGAQAAPAAPTPTPPVAPPASPVAPMTAPPAGQAAQPAHAVPPTPSGPPAGQTAPPPWTVPVNQRQYQGPAPAAGHASTTSQLSAFAASRPTGITILAVLEVIGGVAGIWAGKVLWDYGDFRRYWVGDAGSYQLLALITIAGAIAAFVLAWGLWQIKPWAWMLAVVLSGLSIASGLLNAFTYSSAIGSAAIGVGISAAILYYLNLNSTRAIFGRPPTTMLQPAPGSGIPGSAMPPTPGQHPMPAPQTTPMPPAGATPPPWAQQQPGPAPQTPPTPPPPWAQQQPAPAPQTTPTPPPPWAQQPQPPAPQPPAQQPPTTPGSGPTE